MKITLYYSLVYPYLNYCNLFWVSTYVSNLHKLILLLFRANFQESRNSKGHRDPFITNRTAIFIFSHCHHSPTSSFGNFFILLSSPGLQHSKCPRSSISSMSHNFETVLHFWVKRSSFFLINLDCRLTKTELLSRYF